MPCSYPPPHQAMVESDPSKPESARLSLSKMPFPQRDEPWGRAQDAPCRDDDRRRQHHNGSAPQEWHVIQQSLISHIRTLQGQENHLKEQELKLSQELATVRHRTSLVTNSINQEAKRLRSLEVQHLDKQDPLTARDSITERNARDWSRETRPNDAMSDRPRPPAQSSDLRPQDEEWNSVKLPPIVNLNAEQSRQNRLDNRVVARMNIEQPRQNSLDGRVVALIDTDGTILDTLRSPTRSNHRHASISSRAVHRPVKLRRGRQFMQDDAFKIYDVSDEKGAHWLACMIQSTGAIQARKCRACRDEEGPFVECVVAKGSLFPSCGNCEWKDQRCHGLEPVPASDAAASASEFSNLAPRQSSLDPKRSSPSLAQNRSKSASEIRARGSTEAIAETPQDIAAKASELTNEKTLQGPVSGFRAVNNQPQPELYIFPSLSGVASSAPSDPNSRHMTPLMNMPSHSPIQREDGKICRANLSLRHNGVVFTSPQCVEGVPLEKIDQHHPYWDPEWLELKSYTTPKLLEWEEKLQTALKDKDSTKSVRYQCGRQVHRGYKIMEFLDNGDFNPYQLLSKKYITTGRGGICAYDTLYRLCDTIHELSRYKLDVEPVEWLRQRLHNLIETHGAAFKLANTMHYFYHDAELAKLRKEAGFRNIGRPAGVKMPRGRKREAETLPRPPRRSRTHDTPTPLIDGVDESSVAAAAAAAATEDEGRQGGSGGSGGGKRRKTTAAAAAANILDSLETGDVSDKDSCCGAEIGRNDFRLGQAKTRLHASPEQATQYWTWRPEERLLEHRMLQSADPVDWVVLDGRANLGVRLDDVIKAAWNLKSLRVYLVLSDRHVCPEDERPRGDVMVSFRRENTMRRFIQLCRGQDVELVEETWKKMENLWASMDSKRRRGGRDEGSA